MSGRKKACVCRTRHIINPRFNCHVFRRRAFVFLRSLVPRRHRLLRTPHAGGHLLFCATKKGDKKVAGNAIPRSRLPSERKIAHSRVGSLYPLNERGKEILNRTVIFHSGRTPGSGRNFRRIKRQIAGLPRGRRPARPLTRKLIFNRRINISAGASGAATSTAQLPAYAGGGSGLILGELYIKSYFCTAHE